MVANGVRVHFTPREFGILELLTLRRNTILTKEIMLDHLYGGMDEPDIKIIDVFICKIRSKLAKAGMPNLIRTVWGRGYSIKPNENEDTVNNPVSPQPARSIKALAYRLTTSIAAARNGPANLGIGTAERHRAAIQVNRKSASVSHEGATAVSVTVFPPVNMIVVELPFSIIDCPCLNDVTPRPLNSARHDNLRPERQSRTPRSHSN